MGKQRTFILQQFAVETTCVASSPRWGISTVQRKLPIDAGPLSPLDSSHGQRLSSTLLSPRHPVAGWATLLPHN